MSEWDNIKLSAIATKIGSGATPRGGSNSYKDDGISLIRSQNVLDFQFTTSGLAFIDQEQADELGNVEIEKNDVLLNITGDSVARCCIVPDFVLPARVNQHVSIIRIDPQLADHKFIFYQLQYLKEELLMQSEVGATRKALTKGMIEDLDINLPPLPEQQAITAVLSSLDDKIDLLHRQNKTLEALAQAFFRHWFIDGDDEWEVGCLGDFAGNIRDSVKNDQVPNGTIYIGLEHIDKKQIALSNYGLSDEVNSNKYQFEEEDILFGKLRPYFHKVCFAPSSGICSTDILVIRPKKPHYFCFSLFAFSQKEVIDYADLGSSGTRMPRVNWETLKQYPIALPPDEKVKQFNDLIYPSIEKIKLNLKQLKTLETLRDTLLPKLMSGEVRVSNVPPSFDVEDVTGLFERMGVVETPYPVPAPVEPIELAEEKATYQTGLSDAGLCFLETLHQWEQTSSAPTIGKTIAQKTGYVLKDVGVEMESEFVRGKNGPFSADFAETLKSLQSAGFLRQQPHRRRPIIVVHTEPQYAAQREQFASRLASFKPMIDKTVALVKCFRNKNHAEYVGTVLFVARELEKERGFVAREDVVSQVIKWKPHWFTENRTKNINEAIDFLVEMGFVELA